VLGRPARGKAEILAWDEAGRITHLRQSGWDIEYPGYQETAGLHLPAKVLLKSPRLDLKLVVENWQTDAEP
jgi:outer membrane lipoprotein LolB